MNREVLVLKEKKKKIERIKKKYKNMQMSDDNALKIYNLKITNRILKSAVILAGVITVVDYFIPDPILGLDELALTAITGLLKGSSVLVENKIDAIAKEEDASLKMNEISKICDQIINVVNSIKKKSSL